MSDRKGSDMGPAGGRGSRRSRRSRFHDGVQWGPATLPIGKITRWTPAKPAYLQQAGRFGLLLDRSVPPPVPGPLLGPLIGGLPGSSLLIGQQAACLQLARIKTQLALTQISNAIAAGSRGVASRTVSNTPPCFASTQTPSPTATAINLLNLLKVANMSHNLYDPYSLESQDYSPGSYQPSSAQVDPGNGREPSQMVHGSTHASIGASFGTSMNPSNIHPSIHPGSMGYIPGQSKSATECKSAMDIPINRARGSILKKPAPDQNTPIIGRPEVSLGLGPTGYTSSTPIPQGQFSGYSNTMPSGVVSGASNLPSSYQTKSSEASYNFYPSTSSSSHSAPNIPPAHYPRYSIGDVGNNGGDYIPSDRPSSSKDAAYSQARYTCESAMDILKRFNLLEEDLEELCALSDDQLCPANLPFLLRDIRQKKANRLSAASPSSLVGSGAEVKREAEAPPAFQQPSKVIEYGHTSKYTVGFQEGDEDRGHHSNSVRPSSFSESNLMESSTSQSWETPQKDVATAKYGGPVSQRSTALSPSVYSPLPSVTASPGQRPAARSVQTAITSPMKEPVASQSAAPVAKPAATNIIPKRDSSADRVASAASQRPAQGADTTSQRPAPGAGTTSHKPAPSARTTSHKPAPGAGTTSHKPAPGTGTNSKRPAPGAGTTTHKAAPGTGTTSHKAAPGTGTTSHRPAPGTGTTSHRPAPGTGTTSHRPAPGTGPGEVPSPKATLMNQAPPPASDASIQRPPPVQPAGNRMPTAALISDYMGVTPELFPHTCCLCNKPCVDKKDWRDHRKHIVHRASCRLLCRQYSEWEPDAVTLDPAPEESQQPPTTTTVPAASSTQSSRPSLQATSHGGPAPSNSASPLLSSCGNKSTSSVCRKTSETGKSRSPQGKRSRSKSSGRKGSRSPQWKRSRSPQRKRSRSPQRKRSWSPLRKRSRSPQRKRSRSPLRKRSRSPQWKRPRSRFSGRKRSTSSASSQSPDWERASRKASSSGSSGLFNRSCRSRPRLRSSSSSDRNHGKRPSSPASMSRRRSGSPRRGRGSRSPRDSRPSRRPLRGSRQTRGSRSRSPPPHPSSQRRRSRSRSHERRSSGRRQEETSVERLAKELLESSGGQAFTGSTSLELVVQSLAPVLLAELAKLKAASSSSSTSSKDQKKTPSSSSSRDEQKQSSSSSRDEKKPSSSSSSRDEQKPSSSSLSRDERKPSSSSSKYEKKQSSSSSSRDVQKQASSSSIKGGKKPPSSSSSSSVQGTKKMVKKSVPMKSAKPHGSGLPGFVPAHPPLLLSGLPSTVTQEHVLSAVEKFGKTLLISLAEHRHEATVYFLHATAAQALLGFTELNIGGNPITVTQITESVSPKLRENQASTKPASKAEPGNKMTMPGNKTTTPGDTTTKPGDKTTTPGVKTTTPGDKKTTPGDKTTSPGVKATTPGDKTTMPGDKTTSPGNKTVTPGSKSATPGDTTTTPGDTPTTPITTNMSIGTIISSRPVTTASMHLMSLPPETTPCSSETKSYVKPIECIKVQSWTLADFDPDTMQAEPSTSPSPVTPVPPKHRGVPKIAPTVLFLKSIKCIDVRSWTLAEFQPFASRGATIMVTGLPDKVRGHYREPEMIRVLEEFGKTKCDKYFILPDNCTAFVEMVANKMEQLIDVLANGVPMNGGMLRCHLLKENALGSPIAFYKQLLEWSGRVYDETTLEYRLVYIRNFPIDEDYWMEAFHEGITKTGGVRLYLRLMGKIFVEFVTVEDADRFGVWLSSFRPDPTIENLVRITRPGMVPDMDAIDPVCTNIPHKPSLKGVHPPFWLVVPTRPHLYPTLSPQFYTPAHRTVTGPRDVKWAEISIIGQSVVMVTGLPLGGYSHKDLLNQVWPYFVEKDMSRVFYYVVILPLQRRAFIYFDDGLKCKEFVSDFLHKPFTIGGCYLTLHFLLDHLKPCTTELRLYNQLLRWSHVVPEEKVQKDMLLMTAIEYCSMRALKFLFEIMEDTPYVSCNVLGNRVRLAVVLDRVVFQIPRRADLYYVIANLIEECNKLVQIRSIHYPKPYHFQTRFKFIGDKMSQRRFKGLFKRASKDAPTTSGQSAQHPSAPGQSGAALPTYAPPPAELSASAHDQAGPLGSGPQPPALSQEMYRFFATAIHQHRQARVGQEVSRVGQEVSRVGQEVSRGGQEGSQGGQDAQQVGQEVSRVGQEGSRGGQEGSQGGQDAQQVGQEVSRVRQEGSRGGQDAQQVGQEVSRVGQEGSRGGQDAQQVGQEVSRVGQEGSQEKVTSSGEGRSLSKHDGRSHISLLSSSSASSPLSRRSRASGSSPPRRERREQKLTMEGLHTPQSEGVSEDLIEDPPGLQEEGLKPGKFITVDDVAAEAEPIVIFSSRSEGCDSQTEPSNRTKEKGVPSDQQVPRTSSSSSSTSGGVESNSSTTCRSSSLSEATSSSTSDLPKSSSSSSSLPPPAGVVPSTSEQNTPQKECEESPAQVSEADEPSCQEVTSITTTEEVESLPACQPITKDESPSEAATVHEDDVARLGHKMAAETSAVKSAASLTEQDALHTDPSLEEERKRKAQQELTLPGKDVLVSPTEDTKENRVEVEKTHQQMGDEKTSDHMLHSGPEPKPENQSLVQPETPGLADPESQTSELQEDEMLAKVADEAEPFQGVPEEKMTIVEEQMPSSNEETPTVVSEAADESLNGASTEEDDAHQLMGCVEGSPPKEEFNMDQSNKEPTKEEKEHNKEHTQKEQTTKEQSDKAPTVEEVAPEMEQRQSKRGHPSPVTKPPSTRRSTRRSTRHSTPTRESESPAEDPVKVEEEDYQIVDSVEGDASSPRGGVSPPSGALIPQGQPHPEEDEGDYQVVDSVEGEVVEVKEVQLPTRGKRGRPPKNVRVKKEQPSAPVPEESGKKPDEPLEDQACPARTETEHQEAPEAPGGKEDGAEGTQMADKATPSNAKPRVSGEGVSLEEVATYQVLDSVEDEELEVREVPPVTRGRGRGRKANVVEEAPGRPQRGLAKKEPTPVKDGKHDDTPEGTHTKQDQGKKEEEEEARPGVDSGKQESQGDKQPAAGTRRSGRWRKEEVPVSGTSKMAAKEGQQRVQDSEKEVYQVVDSIEDNPHDEDHVNSSGPTRRSSLAKTRATRTRSEATKGEEPQYLVVDSKGEEPQYLVVNSKGEEPPYQLLDSKGEEEEQIPVEEQLSEEPLRGKRGRKVTASDPKAEDKATKKRKTTEQTPPPLPEDQSETRLVSESVVSQDQMVCDEEKDSPSIVGERKQSEEQAASSKARREEEGVEPERVRCLSPSVSHYTLPPFIPQNPLGMEHVVPKVGFYCNLCSVFYEDEIRAKTLHCSSLSHYHNLKVTYQRLKEERSRSQSGGSAPGPSPGPR